MNLDKTLRVSHNIKTEEMFYPFIRFKFESVDVFDIDLLIPKKFSTKFKKNLMLLKTFLLLSDYEVTKKGNHTILEICIEKDLFKFYLDFHLYTSAFVINPSKPLKEYSKIKRITLIQVNTDMNNEIYDYSNNFDEAIDVIYQYLQKITN